MIFYFSLNISYQDFMPYYLGHAERVEVYDNNGRCLWIHGRHFRQFLTRAGVQGQFKLELNDTGKLVSLCKL